jgi:hypothetical protein
MMKLSLKPQDDSSSNQQEQEGQVKENMLLLYSLMDHKWLPNTHDIMMMEDHNHYQE